MQSFLRTPWRAALAAGALALAACNPSASATDPAFQPGALGNGSFVFACDDAVVCDEFSGVEKFPKQVSLGATFNVRFVAKGANVTVNANDPSQGQTIGGVGNSYLGPSIGGGFAALKAGFATVSARNAQGFIVDFTTFEITKPDSLVIYNADQLVAGSARPVSLDKVTLKVADTQNLRALPRSKSTDLAGSLKYEWSSSDPTVADIGSSTETTATVAAKKAGTTTLSVAGGTFTQTITVEVTP